jgi:enamine deaminase RidA (YjgF/YER057c/UK114 family)
MRKLVSSGSPYEVRFGFSRAVRAGALVAVAGSAPLGPDGSTVGRGDAAAQARRCLEIIATALEGAGGSLRHVVRTGFCSLALRTGQWWQVSTVSFFGTYGQCVP